MIVEKIDRGVTLGSKLAAAFIAGWMGSSVWHQTAVTDKAAVVLPKVEAQAGCERSLAGFNAKLAQQPILLGQGQIPVDHCPSVPPAKSP